MDSLQHPKFKFEFSLVFIDILLADSLEDQAKNCFVRLIRFFMEDYNLESQKSTKTSYDLSSK